MISDQELLAMYWPKDDKEFLRILSGKDRGFLAQFMAHLRAIFTGNYRAIRKNKGNGQPFYDSFSGTWRDANGQVLNTERQIRLEIDYLKRQLLEVTRRYINASVLDNKGRPTIPPELIGQWEARVSRLILNSNIRAYGIGFGNPKESNYQSLQGHIFGELKYLSNFAKEIEQGELKRYDPLTRIAMYADSLLLSYSQGDIAGRQDDDWEGWRQLDPYAAHCPECPTYVTNGYVDKSDIMAIGCCSTCGRNCKCSIRWRRKKEVYYQDLVGINADLLTKAQIADMNFQYYKRMGLENREHARRYVILKRSLGHSEALNQVKALYNLTGNDQTGQQ